jgi:hypothetical protein
MAKKYENNHVDSGYISAHGDIKIFEITQKCNIFSLKLNLIFWFSI